MTTPKEALMSASKDLNIIRVAVESAVKSWSNNPKLAFSVVTAGVHGALDRALLDLAALTTNESRINSLLGQIMYELRSYKGLLLEAQKANVPNYAETVLGQWINVYNKLIGLVANMLRNLAA